MNNKELLINNVKKWIKLDNEIRVLQKEQQSRKNEKKKLSDALIDIMKSNELDCVEVKDGNLNYVKKEVKKPITKKYLMNVLSKYYNGNIEKTSELNNYIMDNRETSIRESIQRHIN